MRKRAALLAVVCTSSVAAAKEPVETSAEAVPWTNRINLMLSGLFGPDASRTPYGFLVGGAIEFPAGSQVDLNTGMSFERLNSTAGPVTVASLVDLTAARHADTSVFVGFGAGPVFAQEKMRFGGRMFAGVEFFHLGPVRLQLAAELIAKFCADDPTHQCPPGERQTWFSGRIGLRL